MELVFATNNQNKILEVQSLLSANYKLVSLKEINCLTELEETGHTLKDNAIQKARYVADTYKVNCFADDTGLEVEALNGEPGVLSARYAGESKDANTNMLKVLEKLRGVEHRNAKFITIICLIFNNNQYLFEGLVKGRIATTLVGDKGFGYDPIFIPDGQIKSFAEMTLPDKNRISHRGQAVQKLVNFLNESYV